MSERDAEMVMDVDGGHDQHEDGTKNKRNHNHLAVQLQTSGVGRCFQISPTTVLDTDNGSDSGSDAEQRSGDSSGSRRKRRKTPDDAPLIVIMSSSDVIHTIVHRFPLDGTCITKVTQGTYGRDRSTQAYFGSPIASYVSVHFCSADGKRWGELRTADGAHALLPIGDAALPSIQAYLRTAR